MKISSYKEVPLKSKELQFDIMLLMADLKALKYPILDQIIQSYKTIETWLLKEVRDHLEVSLLMLSEFQQINFSAPYNYRKT